jgi:hypothetical protein
MANRSTICASGLAFWRRSIDFIVVYLLFDDLEDA